MIGQALGQAASGRDDIDIQVPIIIAAEGKLAAVRRKSRKAFLALG